MTRPRKPAAAPAPTGPAWPRVWNQGPAEPVGAPALHFEIDVETRNPANGDGKDRWAKIHRTEKARGAVEEALTFPDDRIVWLAASGPWCVRLTRLSSAARFLDDDAPPGACKAIRDAVAAALGVDDGELVVAFCYAQERRKGPPGVRVEVWGAAGLPVPVAVGRHGACAACSSGNHGACGPADGCACEADDHPGAT